jgi:hypothetical protein
MVLTWIGSNFKDSNLLSANKAAYNTSQIQQKDQKSIHLVENKFNQFS